MVKEANYFLAAFRKVEPRFDSTLIDKDILKSIFAWVWKNDEYNTLKKKKKKGRCKPCANTATAYMPDMKAHMMIFV